MTDSQSHQDSVIRPARVRFAPSPTGFLHLGGLRTALFNWLYARSTGGQFILRIEDTDQSRFDAASQEDIMSSLRWLGLNWDEGPDIGGPVGPYVQSERKELYTKYAEQLIDSGHAYRAYETPEELAAIRDELAKEGKKGYNRAHRSLTDEQRAAFEAEGRQSVVRLIVPLDGETSFRDQIRGDIAIKNELLQDAILLKSDGMPSYHLAVVVDDHLMEITHIMRSDEWISSTPLHVILYNAFGWEMPQVAHLPVILDPSGKGKMSKRKKVVAGKEYLALVHEFVAAGYLPKAMGNFLTNVGWNFDPEREVFNPEEAIARFNLETINAAPGALPYDKLDWINGIYIREMTPDALKVQLVPFLSNALGIGEETLLVDAKLDVLIPLIQERMKLLTEAADLIDWAFVDADELVYSDPKLLIGKKLDAEQSARILEIGAGIIQEMPTLESEALESAFRRAAADMDVKVGSFFAPFRTAITGKKVSPPLFESMLALDKSEILRRIENAATVLKAYEVQPA